MRWHRLSAFVLIPIIVLLERFAYYAMRSVMYGELTASGRWSGMEVSDRIRWLTWLAFATPLFGGLLAIALKPRWTAAIGAFIAAAGYAVLAIAPLDAFVPGFIVLAFGLGLLRPALYAAAGSALRDPDESSRAALFVGIYGAVNLGALLAAPAAALTSNPRRLYDATEILYTAPHLATLAGVGAVLLGVCAVLTVVLALAPRLLGDGGPVDPPFGFKGEVAAFFTCLLLVPGYLLLDASANLQYPHLPPDQQPWVFQTNPVVVMGTAVLACLAFAGLAFANKRLPSLYFAAAGLFILVLSAVPLFGVTQPAAGGWTLYPPLSVPSEDAASRSLLLVLISFAIGAFGETLLFGLAWSRITASPHPRAATLLTGITMALAGGFGSLLNAIQPTLVRSFGESFALAILLVTMLMAALAAALMVVLQYFGSRRLWNERPAAEAET